MKEHLKTVVWPLGESKGNHRYVIVGMLVTDEPISEFEGKNDIVIDSDVIMADRLAELPNRQPNMLPGDAVNVLLSLEEL